MDKSILWLDDEPSSTRWQTEKLRNHGVEVHHVDNLRDAIEIAKTHDFDFFITDMRMPQINGVDAVKEIRRIKPDIEAAVFSAYLHDEELQKALSKLDKPVPVFSKSLEAETENLFSQFLDIELAAQGKWNVRKDRRNPIDFELQFDKKSVTALLDTGSKFSYISADWLFESGVYKDSEQSNRGSFGIGSDVFIGFRVELPALLKLPGGSVKAINLNCIALDDWDNFSRFQQGYGAILGTDTLIDNAIRFDINFGDIQQQPDDAGIEVTGREQNANELRNLPTIPATSEVENYYVSEDEIGLAPNGLEASREKHHILERVLEHLRNASDVAIETFSGNNVFPEIGDVLDDHKTEIMKPYQEMCFVYLFVLGSRISVHLNNSRLKSENDLDERPELSREQIASLEHLLTIHKSFVMHSDEGKSLYEAISAPEVEQLKENEEYIQATQNLNERLAQLESHLSDELRNMLSSIRVGMKHEAGRAYALIASDRTTKGLVPILTAVAGAGLAAVYGETLGAIFTGSEVGSALAVCLVCIYMSIE